MPPTLSDNLGALQARIRAAEERAGRDPGSARLLAVTKSVGPERTLELARLLSPQGSVVLAENRIDVLESKLAFLAQERPSTAGGTEQHGWPSIAWHFIGHLQRNKARRVVEHCQAFHAVDSLRLLETLQRLCEELDTRLEVFLQAALTGEAEKHGLDEAGIIACFEAAPQMDRLDLAGIMAMGPRPDSAQGPRPVFARAAALGHALEHQNPSAFVRGRCELSLGMSGDLEVAIEAGSHWLRIGGALFSGLPAETEA